MIRMKLEQMLLFQYQHEVSILHRLLWEKLQIRRNSILQIILELCIIQVHLRILIKRSNSLEMNEKGYEISYRFKYHHLFYYRFCIR